MGAFYVKAKIELGNDLRVVNVRHEPGEVQALEAHDFSLLFQIITDVKIMVGLAHCSRALRLDVNVKMISLRDVVNNCLLHGLHGNFPGHSREARARRSRTF